MINLRVSQFKLVLVFTVTLGFAVGAYVLWAVIDFNSNQALHNGDVLSKYTERAISRYKANPEKYLALSGSEREKLIGNDQANLLFDYSQLQQKFKFIPAELEFKNRRVIALVMNYRGFLSPPKYLLILPSYLSSGEKLYSYLLVDENLDDNNIQMRLFEKAQPAIFIALVSILLVIIVELFHISKMNNNINDFAGWASQLSAGIHSSPIPEFSSSKFNYMAFAIDKNLSSISQVLEQEQSFAKFTSHELRTPIAVLSANMEVLELILKDLSPQERKVLKNMESAVSDMKYQMEALLWLSRESEVEVDYVLCNLMEFIQKAIQDNSYLAEGKHIATHFTGEGAVIKTNPVFLQIILNNLLRNAYQNTAEGDIKIEFIGNSIVIENDSLTVSPDKKMIGFGIGLVLVDKLVQKLGINYSVENLANGRRVYLGF
jgi:signal transduction histidine kinase